MTIGRNNVCYEHILQVHNNDKTLSKQILSTLETNKSLSARVC